MSRYRGLIIRVFRSTVVRASIMSKNCAKPLDNVEEDHLDIISSPPFYWNLDETRMDTEFGRIKNFSKERMESFAICVWIPRAE